ncbi:FadR/GntR family transcriptional regulator [Indiicoccus explosivorum]|uniref:FadR/GntR family transcriptional regulator n=1 Tax=Indiicoccus explosivorum TaxID=1917864 RepID=UPI000B44C377|nr:FadR/GntR family transcriptional regulator [Indiicoccus explosivorum]
MEFQTVDKKNLSKQVIDEIIGLLQSGQLKPGDRLPTEMELMTMCNVSRSVMREALSSLEAMGIVNRKTRKGTFFSDRIGSEPFSIMLALSSGNLKSILETRISLELGFVTLAAEKITDEDLERLNATVEAMKEADGDYTATDKEFHEIIAHSASNPLLEAMIGPVLNLYDKTLEQISTNQKNPEITIGHHEAIYEALKEKNPVKAYQAMYTHLSYVRDKALRGLKERQ